MIISFKFFEKKSLDPSRLLVPCLPHIQRSKDCRPQLGLFADIVPFACNLMDRKQSHVFLIFKEAGSSTFGLQSDGPPTSWFNVLQQPHEVIELCMGYLSPWPPDSGCRKADGADWNLEKQLYQICVFVAFLQANSKTMWRCWRALKWYRVGGPQMYSKHESTEAAQLHKS